MNTSRFFALDYVPDPIAVLDDSDTIIFLNQAGLDFLKRIKNSMKVGDYFPDVITTSQKDIVIPVLQHVKREQRPQVLESTYTNPAGMSYTFDAHYLPVPDEHKTRQFICIIIREVTAEKIFQKKTSQLTYNFSQLLNKANAVIFSIDSQKYITDWNDESTRVTGYSKDEVLANPIDSLIAENWREKFNFFINRIFEKQTLESIELLFKSPTQDQAVILLNATPTMNTNGTVIGAVFIGHDITELSNYRRLLEQKIKERTADLQQSLEKEKNLLEIKNRFVSMASHEFRIPLSTISSATQYVVAHAQLDSISMEKLKTIESQIRHMRLLIDDVLIIGKGEAAQLKADYGTVELLSFLKAIIAQVALNANHTHEVKLNAPDTPVEISSDEKLLRNIFINLISNAMKFSPGRSFIKVDVIRRSGVVEISVADEGIGILEADLSRIMQPFNRGSNAGDIKGTGLGLSIVKRAVETLGGKLFISSTPGKGTTMTVSLA